MQPLGTLTPQPWACLFLVSGVRVRPVGQITARKLKLFSLRTAKLRIVGGGVTHCCLYCYSIRKESPLGLPHQMHHATSSPKTPVTHRSYGSLHSSEVINRMRRSFVLLKMCEPLSELRNAAEAIKRLPGHIALGQVLARLFKNTLTECPRLRSILLQLVSGTASTEESANMSGELERLLLELVRLTLCF